MASTFGFTQVLPKDFDGFHYCSECHKNVVKDFNLEIKRSEHEELNRLTEQFLESGGKIQTIEAGVGNYKELSPANRATIYNAMVSKREFSRVEKD